MKGTKKDPFYFQTMNSFIFQNYLIDIGIIKEENDYLFFFNCSQIMTIARGKLYKQLPKVINYLS